MNSLNYPGKYVYKTVPRWMAQGKKIIKTVWIDLNMADEQKPNLRSRLVGKEYSDSAMPLPLQWRQ